ncbi:MAG: hypothetical protein QM783_04485 [Phycisphaerales bacterium]
MASTAAQQHDLLERSQKRKGAFAIAVTIICIVFVVWALWPKPAVVIQEATDPAANWTKAYGALGADHAAKKDAFYWASARINTEPTADKQGIIVRGKVNTAQELAMVKDELGKLQPAVTLDWQVTIGK